MFKITRTFQCQNFQSKSILIVRFVNLHRLINTVALRCSARPLALTAISPPSISWSYLLVSSFTDALHLLFGWKFLLNSKSPVMHFCKVKRFITGLLKFNRNLPLWNKKKKKKWIDGALSPKWWKLLRNNLKRSTAGIWPSTPKGARYTARPQWRWVRSRPNFSWYRFGYID